MSGPEYMRSASIWRDNLLTIRQASSTNKIAPHGWGIPCTLRRDIQNFRRGVRSDYATASYSHRLPHRDLPLFTSGMNDEH
jgi:hypothetical protein